MADMEKVIKETKDGIAFAESRGFGGLANTMRDVFALLKEQEEQIKTRNESLEKAREEIKWLRGILKEQEARELTMDEWREWKADSRRNPICMLWENDTSPIWILNPNAVHEPALLMGKLKLFTGKLTFEQCKEVKWE